MAKGWTKGDWRATKCDDGLWMVATDGDTICFGDPNHQEPDDSKNFALIAAAPDLYEALEKMVETMREAAKVNNRRLSILENVHIKDAEAALSKAEGRIAMAKEWTKGDGKRWPRAGDKMRFLACNGYDHELKEALGKFKKGEVLTVEDCHVEDWSHSVRFAGFSGRFNGVMFELFDAAALSKAEGR